MYRHIHTFRYRLLLLKCWFFHVGKKKKKPTQTTKIFPFLIFFFPLLMKYLKMCLWNDKTDPSGWIVTGHKVAQASYSLFAMQVELHQDWICLGWEELPEGCTSAVYVVLFWGVASESLALGTKTDKQATPLVFCFWRYSCGLRYPLSLQPGEGS